jgi:hypothetical protein
LTSFPEIDTSKGTNFQWTWQNCTGLGEFPALDMKAMTAGNSCFLNVTLDTASYNALLIKIESGETTASSVTFDGGNSLATGAGAQARTDLENDHSWTITDGDG